MIVKSMTIENFRPYKGPVHIDFSEGDKNITIIQGRNDMGKTSFINAFTWCLYDKEPFRDEGAEGRCNQLALDKVNIKDEVTVKVIMNLEDSSGRDIEVIRQQTYIKTSKILSRSKHNSELIIKRDDGLSKEKIDNPEKYIQNNLPESLQEYFMFTGEKLTQFFNKDQNYVKNGVYTLYQLDLLENINNQAKKWEKYYSTKFSKINPQLSKLYDEKSRIVEDQQNSEIEIRENEERIETLQVEIGTLYADLGSSGSDAEELKNDIIELKDEKRSLKQDLKDLKKEYSSIISNNFSLVMSFNLLNDLDKWKEIEDEIEDEEEISFVVSDLKRLLKNHKCVCGASLDEHTDSYKHIEDLINSLEQKPKAPKHKIEEIVANLLDITSNILSRYPTDIVMDLSNKKQRIREIEHDIESKELKISGLENRLKNLDIDNIDKINEEIDEKNKEILKLSEDNTVKREFLSDVPYMLEEVENAISDAVQDENIKDKYSDKREFCEKVKLISKQIYDDLSVNIYETLTEVVTREYKNIHWKPVYKNIIVDQDFKVLVEKNNGHTVAATDPSTGSRNVLALTFMAALNSLSDFVLPEIIDTPIASLDLNMRSEVAKALPNYMKGKQMILLVMDSEYAGEFKENIKPFVGHQYKLDYIGDSGEGQTVIKKLED